MTTRPTAVSLEDVAGHSAGRDLVRGAPIAPISGREVDFCHTFFGLKDGGSLAFFQFADPEMYALTQAKEPPKVGSHFHIALKASDQTYAELKARLNAAGEKFRETDHGWRKS